MPSMRILEHFQLASGPTGIEATGSGHINSSFHVLGREEYLLQRINHRVFPDVAGLMTNIQRVTEHLRGRMERATDLAEPQLTLQIIPTHDGALFQKDEDGAYWRVYEYLSGLHAYDLVEHPDHAYEGARSYGYFLRFLDDFPHARVVPVLPDFHNVIVRLRALEAAAKAAEKDPALQVRWRECRTDLRRIFEQADARCAIQIAWDKGVLKTRVTHNDTKFNNVLLTPAGKGKAVVDLDTVMPGIVHFDYGDGLRTATATAAEDEADLQLVGSNPELYRAFTEGYLEVTQDYLSPAERHYLPQSGALLAYLMAVRFYTDYLRGDVYFGIKHPEHNLLRARNQLRLCTVLAGGI